VRGIVGVLVISVLDFPEMLLTLGPARSGDSPIVDTVRSIGRRITPRDFMESKREMSSNCGASCRL
jgi:hypothetical protein